MKILVFGANGMLGTDLCRILEEKGHETIKTDINELDFTRLCPVLDMTQTAKPELIINCAAYTNVNGCETEIQTAYRANAIGPKNLAIAAQKLDCPLVHISTDYIFDGKKNASYLEDDTPNPLGIYGKSKLAGENNIRSLCNRYYLIRTQWLYGLNGKNFVDTMLRRAEERPFLKVVNDQFGSPTYARDLARAIARLIETPDYGVYHLTNGGVASWFEFTEQIMTLAGLEKVQVSPCSTEEFTREFPGSAPRPAYSPLENQNWMLGGYEPLRPYREALREYIEERNRVADSLSKR